MPPKLDGGSMKARFASSRLFLVCALVLALTAAHRARAQDLVPWRQGAVTPKGDAGFWWMAAEGGFAKQQGLDLKMRAFDSDIRMVDALRAGELDALEGNPATPMIATSKGGDLKMLGCTWPKLTYAFFARPELKSLADLRGKTIGISSPGSLADLVARPLLGRIDIDPKEVKFVDVGSDTERVRA